MFSSLPKRKNQNLALSERFNYYKITSSRSSSIELINSSGGSGFTKNHILTIQKSVAGTTKCTIETVSWIVDSVTHTFKRRNPLKAD